MFEILKTTTTGRQMLQTATKTLGSVSVVVALIGFAGGLGIAQTAGSLDTTFGTGGIVMDSLDGHNLIPLTAIEQSNGDIVMVGGFENFVASETFGLTRFTASGKLDKTFGTNGITLVAFTASLLPSSIAVQPDGAIVVVGSSETTQGGFGIAMARFTPNGQMDTTFGNGGLVTVQPPGIQPTATAVMVQPNNQILVGGYVIGINDHTPGAMVLGRYDSNGSLDTTFGTGGFAEATTAVGSPSALALLANGSYLAVGQSGAVAEFSSIGVLQPTVTPSAVVATSGSVFPGNPVVFQPNGDYILGRGCWRRLRADDQILRFSETGAVDSSFSSTPFGFPGAKKSMPQALALQSNGQVLVGGIPFGLARLNSDGELDTTFGTGGTVETPREPR